MNFVKMFFTLLNFEFATLLFFCLRDSKEKTAKFGLSVMSLLYLANMFLMWL